MQDKLMIKFLKPFPYMGKTFKKGKKGKILDLCTIAESFKTAQLAANNLKRKGLIEIV